MDDQADIIITAYSSFADNLFLLCLLLVIPMLLSYQLVGSAFLIHFEINYIDFEKEKVTANDVD